MRISTLDNEFAEWAFGDDWYDYLLLDTDDLGLLRAWNARHGDKLALYNDEINSSSIWKSLSKMQQIWMQHVNREP